jgi:hypothetical protein
MSLEQTLNALSLVVPYVLNGLLLSTCVCVKIVPKFSKFLWCRVLFYPFPLISTTSYYSDGAGHITPGVLCREFLAEHISLSTPVVMGGSATPFVRTLAQLYPFSSVYGRVGRDEALTVAARFAECIQLPNNADQALYKQVVTATAGDALDFLHPIRYWLITVLCATVVL